MINQLSFRGKIAALVVTAVGGGTTVTTVATVQGHQQIVEARRSQLVTAVQSAYQIAAGYRTQEAAGRLSRDDAQKAAREAIRLARYGGADGHSDYFYVWRMDGVGVMHPIKPEWEGQPMIGKVKDTAGADVVQALIDGVRSSKGGHAFVDTNFPRPGQTVPQPKLQYVAKVEGWDWIVGSGPYLDDMNAQLGHALLYCDTIIVALPTCNQSGSNYHEDLKTALHAEYKAHMEKNALALVNTFSDSFVSVDKGRIGFPGREESLKRFESYYDKDNFIEWGDVTPPVIRFSNDKSLAYVIVRKQVILEIKSNPGTYDTTHFAWTGIYRQENKTWKLECITSINA